MADITERERDSLMTASCITDGYSITSGSCWIDEAGGIHTEIDNNSLGSGKPNLNDLKVMVADLEERDLEKLCMHLNGLIREMKPLDEVDTINNRYIIIV